MKEYIANIEEETRKNEDYRRVLYTGRYTQLVVMSLQPGVEIGNEIHGLDQFIRVEEGEAKVILNNGEVEKNIKGEWAVIIPAGTWHNVINAGKKPLKLYTLYSPPNHRDGIAHQTKAQAEADDEHFDGITTE